MSESAVIHIPASQTPLDVSALQERINSEKTSKIIFGSGCHYLTDSIVLNNTHNLQIIGEEGAVLVGGQSFTFEPAEHLPEVKKLLPHSIAKQILYYDMAKSAAILSPFEQRGFYYDVSPGHTTVFDDDNAFKISSYPKNNYAKIVDFGESKKNEWNYDVGVYTEGFIIDEERPLAWQNIDNLWACGYWSWDWADAYESIASIAKNGMVHLDFSGVTKEKNKAVSGLAFRKGQRYRFLNILEELQNPGEYYLDFKNQRVYLIPFSPEKKEYTISLLRTPMFELTNCHDIKIKNLRIEKTCGYAIYATECTNLHIDKNNFLHLGNYAVHLDGSESSVTNNSISYCGDGGVLAIGGQRTTLTPANIIIENNHFHHIGEWSKTYKIPISMTGCGITSKNNLIHDCPHMAIMFSGNEMLVENNEIYSILKETGDAGAIYAGRDFTFRGNMIRGNYIHHLGGVGIGTMGIYNDDCVSGTVIENNTFHQMMQAVFIGGGRDIKVKGNLFVECDPSIIADGRGRSDSPVWERMIKVMMKERYYNIAELNSRNILIEETADPDALKLYLERYPEMADIDTFYREMEDVRIPPSAQITENAFCTNKAIVLNWDAETGDYEIHANKKLRPTDFADFNRAIWGNSVLTGANLQTVGAFDSEQKQIAAVFSGLLVKNNSLLYLYKNTHDKTFQSAATVVIKGEYTEQVREVSVTIPAKQTGEIALDLKDIDYGTCTSVEITFHTPGVRPATYKKNGFQQEYIA